MKFKASGTSDRRGKTPEARQALVKARDARRNIAKNPGKPNVQPEQSGASAAVPALQFNRMLRGSPNQLHQRISKYIALLEQEPGALTATVIGTLMADLHEANTVLGKSWAFVNNHLDNNGDPREVLKLLEELRKWTETLQEASLRVAEIQSKGLGQNIAAADPLNAYRFHEEEEEPETVPVAETVEEEPPDDPDIENDDMVTIDG